MNYVGKALAVFAIAAMGLWGCAQGPANKPATAERLRALEAKIAKLEEDFRSAVTARDQLRKKLTTVEEERAQLIKQVEQLQVVTKERDELRTQLNLRTSERDNLNNQFEQFRKGIKNLLGQLETGSGQPAISVTETTGAGASSD